MGGITISFTYPLVFQGMIVTIERLVVLPWEVVNRAEVA